MYPFVKKKKLLSIVDDFSNIFLFLSSLLWGCVNRWSTRQESAFPRLEHQMQRPGRARSYTENIASVEVSYKAWRSALETIFFEAVQRLTASL